MAGRALHINGTLLVSARPDLYERILSGLLLMERRGTARRDEGSLLADHWVIDEQAAEEAEAVLLEMGAPRSALRRVAARRAGGGRS